MADNSVNVQERPAAQGTRIAVLYIGIGDYVDLFDGFHRGAEAFFFPGIEKTYYLFTDRPERVPARKNVRALRVKSCDWPWPTLNRFAYTLNLHRRVDLLKHEHLFFFNANCRFLQVVDARALLEANLVACIHPGYHDKKPGDFAYERRSHSSAFVPAGEGCSYYAGGLQGGRSRAFLEAYAACQNLLDEDLTRRMVAVWHDESYRNRFLIDRRPDLALPPSYLYPESFRIPFSPIIFLLEKKHIMRLDPRRMPRVAPATGSGPGPQGPSVERPE